MEVPKVPTPTPSPRIVPVKEVPKVELTSIPKSGPPQFAPPRPAGLGSAKPGVLPPVPPSRKLDADSSSDAVELDDIVPPERIFPKKALPTVPTSRPPPIPTGMDSPPPRPRSQAPGSIRLPPQ